jgi:hypothetical protein
MVSVDKSSSMRAEPAPIPTLLFFSFFLQVNIKQIGGFYLKIYQNNIFKIKILK